MTFLYLALSRVCIILLALILPLIFLRETFVTEQPNMHYAFLAALDILMLLYSIFCDLILSNSLEFLVIMHLKRYCNSSLGSNSIENLVE